jgi:hypothetical protein
MKHKDKLKLAKKMAPKLRTGFFLTEAWQRRKDAVANRVAKKLLIIKKVKNDKAKTTKMPKM